MDYLKSKPSLGQIILLKEKEENEVYSIGEGHFSISSKNDSTFLHFYIKAEYEIEISEPIFVSGPILKFHFELDSKLKDFTTVEINVPIHDNHETNHFYHQVHQGLINAKLIIKKVDLNLFEIQFLGIPSDDFKYYSVTGKCILPLKNMPKDFI